MSHNIHFSCDDALDAADSDEKYYKDACALILDFLSEEGIFYDLNLNLVSDEEIREVNRQHRSKDRPTDVLSFPMMTDEEFPGEGNEALGDLLISHETCRRQAEQIGHSFQDEMMRLMVHGILHLFGYDHEISEEEERIMMQKEDEILEMLSRKGF